MSAFQGMLTKLSPLRTVFPRGLIPLKSPISELARLGEGANEQEARVYLVAIDACTPAEKDGMAALMAKMGQGTIQDIRQGIDAGTPIPAREINFDGVSFPLRYVN